MNDYITVEETDLPVELRWFDRLFHGELCTGLPLEAAKSIRHIIHPHVLVMLDQLADRIAKHEAPTIYYALSYEAAIAESYAIVAAALIKSKEQKN